MLGIFFFISMVVANISVLLCQRGKPSSVQHCLEGKSSEHKQHDCLWGLDSVGSYHGTSLVAFFPNSLVVRASHAGEIQATEGFDCCLPQWSKMDIELTITPCDIHQDL